jgi:hypothetical protein
VTAQRLRDTSLHGVGVRARDNGGDAEATALTARVDGLRRFLRAGEVYLPAERLAWARTVVTHAEQRLALSREHTVVALAGATGGGKSSLFNALAGQELSPVGVRRPTTSEAYACVWGAPEEITDLLEWLKITPAHWFGQAQVVDGQSPMRGLVLLDLPDFDSVEREHAAEVTRLLGLVDLVVWVVDPQKYADQVIHERHLPRFRRHREVTLVALNQADLLSARDLEQLMADLRRLLNADGLDGVRTIATSAVDAPAGLAELQARLEEVVNSRRAVVQRLAADVDLAVADLSDLVGPPAAEELVGPSAVRQVAHGLADVAGAAAVVQAMVTSYRHRAGDAMAWPLLRSLRRRGPDPWRRTGGLALGAGGGPGAAGGVAGPGMSGFGGPVTAPETAEGPRAAASLVARTVGDRAAAGLPDPWPEVVSAAARSRLDGLPEALDQAVAITAARAHRTPRWWRAVGAAEWVATAAALVGLGWLVLGWLLAAIGIPIDQPQAGPLSVPVLLLVAGVGVGLLLALAARPLARWAARRASEREAERLRAAITDLGRTRVVAPVAEVLRAYAEARDALADARGRAG